MNPTPPTSLRSLTYVVAVSALMVFFQNCTNAEFSTRPRPIVQGNGEPYDGKVYVSQAKCADDTPKTIIQALSQTQARILKSACVTQAVPIAIGAADFTVDGSVMHWQNQVLIEETAIDAVHFLQKTGVHTDTVMRPGLTATLPSLPSATQAGDLVVCFLSYDRIQFQTSIIDISDEQGNSYKRAVGPISSPNARWRNFNFEVWYAANIAGGPQLSPTVQFEVPLDHVIQCLNYTGLAAGEPLIDTQSADGLNPGPISYGPLNAGSGPGLIVSAVYADQSNAGMDFNLRSKDHLITYQDKVVSSGPAMVNAEALLSDWISTAVMFRAR